MAQYSKFFSQANFRTKRRALMLAVFLMLVVAELAVGTGLIQRQPYLLAVPLAPLFLLWQSARLELGLLVILICMMTIRFEFSTGTASKLPLSLVLTGLLLALWLTKMALNHKIRFLKSPLNLPASLFLGVVVLTLFWSRFLLDPQVIISDKFLNVQLGTIGVTACSIILTVLCYSLIRQTWIVKACYWICIVGSLWYLPNYLVESTQTTIPDVVLSVDEKQAITLQTLSRLVNSAGLFPMWMCALTLALLLFCRNHPRWQRILMMLALSGWLFRLIVVTIARVTGWLPTLVALLVVIFVYSRKWFVVLVLTSAVLVAINYQSVYETVVVVKQKEGTLDSETSRTNLLIQAFKVAQIHPLLGTGPAGYANYYMTYYRELALSTHNNYLDMLLQYGLVGLGLYLWLCITMIKELWKSKSLHPPNSFEKAFTIGAFGASIGMMAAMWLGDWVIPFAYNQTISGYNYTGYNWLFIGLALALAYTAKERALSENNAK